MPSSCQTWIRQFFKQRTVLCKIRISGHCTREEGLDFHRLNPDLFPKLLFTTENSMPGLNNHLANILSFHLPFRQYQEYFL